MKIIVLGGTGMLGHMVFKYLSSVYGSDVTFSCRKNVSNTDQSFHYDAISSVCEDIPDCDYIINCIGIVKPLINKNIKDSILVNSCFPLVLSNYCKGKNIKLIHITTDCVFSGREGKYTEDSPHDAIDIYGKTKSLGESCQDKAMVIRTSIIGEEIKNALNLVEWVKSQKGKQINGYTNHLWNGVTTLQYAKICEQIIKQNLYEIGLYHVFSNVVNKYELVSMINKYFELGITIELFEAEIACDRTMSTVKKLKNKLDVPTIEEQLKEISKL